MATCDPKEAKNDLHEENVRGLDCKFFNGCCDVIMRIYVYHSM